MCGTRRHAYTPEHVRRAEDCPPYQCNCYGARASTPAEIRLRSALLSPSFHSTGTVAPQERPQSSSVHRLALRPRWPRSGLARRAGVLARRNIPPSTPLPNRVSWVLHSHTPGKTSNPFGLPAGTAARMAARQSTKKLGVITAMTR